MKTLGPLFVAFVALVSLAGAAGAQTQDLEINVTVVGHTGVVAGSPSDHFLSFSAPFEIPGVGLAPGAYIFRFITPSVMQVLSENRSTVYAMLLVIPTWRNEVSGEYSVSLRKTRDDAPPRLWKMFPPNSSSGYELTYPKGVIGTERVAMK